MEKDLPSVTEPPRPNVNEICMPGRWYPAALESQRAVFAHAEDNGVAISEGRLQCGDEFLNYVTATPIVGGSARSKRMAARVHELEVCVPGCHRPLGRVLVMMASWGGGIGLFARVLPALMDHFEVIYCIDFPGMGLSSRWAPDSGLSSVQIVNEYGRLFSLGFDSLASRDNRFKFARTRVLAVHSMGTQFIMRWIVNGGMAASTSFHMLTLISPLGVPSMKVILPLEETLNRREKIMLRTARFYQRSSITPQSLFRSVSQRIARPLFERIIFPLFTVQRMPPEMVDYLFLLTRAPCNADRLIYRVLMAEDSFDFRYCVEQLVERVKIPVALLFGDDDFVDFKPAADEILREMSGACIVHQIEETRHVPFFENVADFANEFVDAFRNGMLWNSEQKEMRARPMVMS